jgi:hypothetical protein
VNVEKFRVPEQDVVKAYENEGRRFGTTKFLMYTMPRIFLQRFKNDPKLQDFVARKCYLQVKISVQFYREQPIVGETFQLNRTITTFYDSNFRRREYLVQSINDLKGVLRSQTKRILAKIENYFEGSKSEWIVERIFKYDVRLIHYEPFFSISKGFLPTPEWLRGRKSIINIKNLDDQCFLKCIYRHYNKRR